MKRFVLASCAALLVLAPVLAFAQSRTPPAGSSSVGSASPRGGESGGASSAPPASSGSGSSGAPSVGSAGPSGGSYASPVSGGVRVRNYDGPRSGEASPMSARPRSASSATVGQAVPVSERPRGDRPVYGQAVPRGSKPAPSNVVIGSYPYYYDPYGYFGYLSGRGYYDYYSYYSPYSLGMPFWGYGMYGYPMSVYSSYWNDYAGTAAYTTSAIGSIKLKVRPKEAEVYVDGTFYGQVDNYDGTFQHLDLSPGTHRLEIRANGYQTLQMEMRVLPGKTITYTGELKPAK